MKVTRTVFGPGGSAVAAPRPLLLLFSSPIGLDFLLSLLLELSRCDRMRSRGTGAQIRIGSAHGLALDGFRNSRVHHQFRESHGSLIQGVDGGTNGLVIVTALGFLQLSFKQLNSALFIPGQLLPCRAAAAFFERQDNVVRLHPVFYDLAFPEILLRVIVGG